MSFWNRRKRISRRSTSGEREPWLQLSPPDPAGVFVVDRIHLSADGRAYVCSNRRVLSNVAALGRLEQRSLRRPAKRPADDGARRRFVPGS